MYDITYSHCLQNDLPARPVITNHDMWQVHYYTHADHRYTWDISDGRVFECRRESFRLNKRRNRLVWMCDEIVNDPLPIEL